MNDKLELDIPVLLPDLPDAADACLDRLVSTLSKREGVERAHVICLDGDTPAALCIHFDAAKLPLPRLREMVRAAGAEITERYGHAIWQVTGISHERRARTVSDALCALPGRSEEHTSELQSLMRSSYAVFCLKKKKKNQNKHEHNITRDDN